MRINKQNQLEKNEKKEILISQSKNNKLFKSLTNDLSNNIGFKYNQVCNLMFKIFENNKWIMTTIDRKHGNKIGFKAITSNGFKISDSLINRNNKIEPSCIKNLKNFLKELIKDERFINPFQ